MNTLFHGGDLHSASAIYGRAPEDWLDLSTGINQFSYPAPAMGQEVWQQLPYLAPSLIKAAHSYYGQHACLACSGSQTVIQLLPVILRQLGNQKATWLPDIGYQEHLQAWSQEGEVSTYSGLDSQLATQQIADALHDDKIGHLVIINPNNPTGEVFSRQQLNLWAQQLRNKGGFLVIDEAFIDITPRASVLCNGTSRVTDSGGGCGAGGGGSRAGVDRVGGSDRKGAARSCRSPQFQTNRIIWNGARCWGTARLF